MIDLHCHVLPGIDDGPPTVDDALELARAAVALGTDTMVATPHVSWDWPANDARLIGERVADMQRSLDEEGVPLRLRAGAEVALTRAGDLDDEELAALRLGGGKWLLVEPPFSPTASGFEAVLSSLVARGNAIVIAHPERIPAFQRNPSSLEQLVARGMLTSVTAGSLVGRFGRDVQRFALELLRVGLVHNVASDAHDALRRPPGTQAELAEVGLERHADWLTRSMPRMVIDGGPTPPAPSAPMPAAERTGVLGRLFKRA